MGKLEHEAAIQHPSHPHPLWLSSDLQALVNCSGCGLPSEGWIYACKPCGFFLHVSCAELPETVQHPAHPLHSLSLLPYLACTSEGKFVNCSACGESITSFSYHCPLCQVYLHTLCANVPLFVQHPAHNHPLVVAFAPPYHGNGFYCNLCGHVGTNHWLYRCGACNFDVHLGCALAQPGQSSSGQSTSRSGSRPFFSKANAEIALRVAQTVATVALGVPVPLTGLLGKKQDERKKGEKK